MRRLFNATVWSPYGVPNDARRFANIFRVVLPLHDVLFVWFGVFGVIDGVPRLSEAVGDTYVTWWAAGVALTALVALVGVVFPKLWSVELIGRICLTSLIAAYAAISIKNGFTDVHQPAYAGMACTILILGVWRISDLGVVAWRRGHWGKPWTS